VQSQEGMYGFELRSFQEFMAAWQVVSLHEVSTDALLRRIAPLDAWRNVVLLVIGHQYAKSSTLAWKRSIGLCAALDEEMPSVLRGGRLALEILADRPYGKGTKSRDELVAIAVGLLRLPHGYVHQELARRLWEIDPNHLIMVLDKALS